MPPSQRQPSPEEPNFTVELRPKQNRRTHTRTSARARARTRTSPLHLPSYPIIVKPNHVWKNARLIDSAPIRGEDGSLLHRFRTHDFVTVRPERRQSSDKPWIARIIQVRESSGSDFVLVCWMYRPEDLPSGRQPFHGANELVYSNHMDVLETQSLEGPATVREFKEYGRSTDTLELEDDELFYRQTYDVVKRRVSKLPKHCQCETPWNPDTMLVYCKACSTWLHGPCIERKARVDAFENPAVRATFIGNDAADDHKPLFAARLSTPARNDTRLTVSNHAVNGLSWLTSFSCLCCANVLYQAPPLAQQQQAMDGGLSGGGESGVAADKDT